jgi:uncharacterized membrane protein (UPF0127 family)
MQTFKKTFVWTFLISASFPGSLFAENLTLTCPQGDILFKVELAQTPEEQQKGLMFRTQLDQDAGMLFIYKEPHTVAMWMKNTPLSLDMIFCDQMGKILNIHEMASPYSLKTIGPIKGVAYVLEVRGGIVQNHNISKACIVNVLTPATLKIMDPLDK